MASYSNAQHNNSGAELAEDGETTVAWGLALSGPVLARSQGRLGSWEHI